MRRVHAPIYPARAAVCTRYALTTTPVRIASAFGVPSPPLTLARFNIAPSQNVLTVRPSSDGTRTFATMRWGLTPKWTREPAARPLFNARAESLADKPTFRDAARARRCLVPADGFYEWVESGGRKHAYWIRLPYSEPFAFAGIWERSVGRDGAPMDTVAIVTTDANDDVRVVHDRMPVMLTGPAAFARWLDPRTTRVADLQDLLRPAADGSLLVTAVGPAVNDFRNEGPECIAPERVAQLKLWDE